VLTARNDFSPLLPSIVYLGDLPWAKPKDCRVVAIARHCATLEFALRESPRQFSVTSARKALCVLVCPDPRQRTSVDHLILPKS
jgi:hypothetical protein